MTMSCDFNRNEMVFSYGVTARIQFYILSEMNKLKKYIIINLFFEDILIVPTYKIIEKCIFLFNIEI